MQENKIKNKQWHLSSDVYARSTSLQVLAKKSQTKFPGVLCTLHADALTLYVLRVGQFLFAHNHVHIRSLETKRSARPAVWVLLTLPPALRART